MPALALAEEMVRLDASVRPVFIGGLRGIEANVLPQRPWPYELLPLQPIWRKRWWRNAALPLSVLRSLAGIRAILNREAPALVVGTGGYVSGPVVWAAMNRGVPAVLQEQNAYPGIATRLLARRARQVHLGFPEARAFLKPGASTQVFDSGNPIQPPPLERPVRSDAKRALGFDPAKPLVLVLGGSQGALPINRAVATALASRAFTGGISLLWQTGAATHAQFAGYAEQGRIDAVSFIDPIASAYAAADLVVARSGAMTMAELSAWGLPSILVPLPTAAAGHQRSNARALAAAGAALLLEQQEMTGPALAKAISSLLGDPARMAGLGAAVLRRARPNAAAEIVSQALRLALRN
jgi:UDP-N-acetylglucosamine--N-acetylmuramyl-(pentapeptide) pyrophosphoryl-undecaprenol N-acetylglucosamine transferase